jgi:hypothetical protein
MIPFVVDANAIHCFQTERITATPGQAHDGINAICAANCIALDTEKICLQEWIDCAGGKFPFALSDWIGDQIVTGKIRFFNLAPNTCRKDLTAAGLPTPDHKWVRLAIGAGAKHLVTEDIDFFDPSQKKASASTKAQLKASKSGPCAKHLRKTYGISVMCLAHVPDAVVELYD